MDHPREAEQYYTYQDLLDWGETPRVELVEGAPYMFAMPTPEHQLISQQIQRQLADFLAGKPCRVYPPIDVRLFEKDDESVKTTDTVVQPDISVICDRNKIDKWGCKGAPDMVIEILSPSTKKWDRTVKHRLYERAGVREYWIIDPETRTAQVYQLEDGTYYGANVYTERTTVPVGIFEGCTIDLHAVFAAADV